MARELDEDPEQLGVICLQLSHYARAKAAFESEGDEALKAWRGNPLMSEVKRNVQAQLQRIAEERKKIFGD